MDEPIASAWRNAAADGAGVTLVEVSAEVSRSGLVLAVIDLSDSSPVVDGDLPRLRRLLSSLPRGWTVELAGLSGTLPASGVRGDRVTVGHVVDGVVDLLAVFMDPQVVGRMRAAGSFLGPTVEAFVQSAGPVADQTRVGVVLTDGRLADVDPVRLPGGMRLVGIAPAAGGHDRHRWREVVGDHEFIGSDGDPVGALRALAGCAFHGPCTVTIPCGTYRVQAGHDGTSPAGPPSTERQIRWDFSLGRLRLEFTGQVPAHLDVAGAGGAAARVVVPTAAGEWSALGAAEPAGPTQMAMAAELLLAAEEAREILRRAGELSAARASWFADDGTPTLVPPGSAVAVHLLDATGRPAADAFLLIGSAEIDAADGGSVALLVVPVRRAAPTTFAVGAIGPEAEPLTVRQTWSVHFDNLEARWIVTIDRSAAIQLPPRGSHAVPVDVCDCRERRCVVFFSGNVGPSR
jgi:hypothetical protein